VLFKFIREGDEGPLVRAAEANAVKVLKERVLIGDLLHSPPLALVNLRWPKTPPISEHRHGNQLDCHGFKSLKPTQVLVPPTLLRENGLSRIKNDTNQ
jgi:hypothetical protein